MSNVWVEAKETMNHEVWALEVVRDGNISLEEFAAELPRIGALLKIIKPEGLKKMLVDVTMKGTPLRDVLTDIENINEILMRVVGQGQVTFEGFERLKETLEDG